jgi:hypothetical protein
MSWWEYGTIEELYTFHKVKKGRALARENKLKGHHMHPEI